VEPGGVPGACDDDALEAVAPLLELVHLAPDQGTEERRVLAAVVALDLRDGRPEPITHGVLDRPDDLALALERVRVVDAQADLDEEDEGGARAQGSR
jgi:hypothetical protein